MPNNDVKIEGSEDIEIEIEGADISFRRYRDKDKNDILIEMLSELVDESKLKWITAWIRDGENMLDIFNPDNDMIFCG